MRRREAEAAAARELEEAARGQGEQGAAEGGSGGAVRGQQRGTRTPMPGRGLDPALLPLLPQKVFNAEAGLESRSQQGEAACAKDGSSALGSAPFADAASCAGAPETLLLKECPVCLSEYEHGDIVKWVPACGHAFHGSCIESWLSSKTTCPLCRMQVAPSLQALSKASKADNEGPHQGERQPGNEEV